MPRPAKYPKAKPSLPTGEISDLEIVDVKGLCQILNISRRTYQAWADADRLPPHFVIGTRNRRFPLAMLRDWIREQSK